MAEVIHYREPNSPEMKARLAAIPPTPGVCIFIDLVDSTAIKYQIGMEDWASLINNTFNAINLLNHFPDYFIKGIGDELMVYLPDHVFYGSELVPNYFTLLYEMYSTVENIRDFPLENVFLQCKVSMHHCMDAYNISFFEEHNDYYGQDIDFSARLNSIARSGEILISEEYHQKLLAENNPTYPALSGLISDQLSMNFKGVGERKYRIVSTPSTR
jgi:class 3 adenylate cyclase